MRSDISVLDSLWNVIFKNKRPGYTRRWPRLLTTEPARLSLEGGIEVPTLVIQLSVGGARVESSTRLEEGDVVVLSVDMGLGAAHDIEAKVVHANKEDRGSYICGLSFVNLDADQVKHIAKYISDEQQRRRSVAAMLNN